jgi:DNA-binding NarL/FixJ family response regulator
VGVSGGHSRSGGLARIDGRSLTPREQAIVELLVRGWTNRQIAQRLALSEHTVKVRMGRLFAKLGVKSRLQLAMRVLRT